nr:hypothetical protein [Nitrospinaceae bacterium]NIR55209.1 hypothetical protein [Nitrospinaceae bacterium]NIT82481.1 hypothetical protein [Nitrospinaceae bacterium]NIU44686.1 hypothetical protein [Nitrospinaceae bacterium]NIU96853.1 hypothetical protein [Nitrospinaceae bacterium]
MDNPEKIELRRRHPHPILAFVLTAVLIGVAGQAEPPSRELLIVYSGNALGELKPCGCDKEEDQGGIERRMGYLKRRQASKTQTLLVDLGDNFKKPTRQGKLKAQTMMKALAQMQYDAITPGDKDLVYGNGFLASGGPLPWVSANLRLDGFSMPASKTQVLDNGLKVFITAVADPDLFYTSPDSNIRLSDPREAFRRQLKRARESEPPDLVVVLTHMPRDKGVRFLDVPGVDVVINGHIEKDSDKIDMNPVIKDGKIFVQPGPLGQKMGELF